MTRSDCEGGCHGVGVCCAGCVCCTARLIKARSRYLFFFFQGRFSLLSCRCKGVFAPQTRIPTLLIVFCVHVLLLVGRCEFRPK